MKKFFQMSLMLVVSFGLVSCGSPTEEEGESITKDDASKLGKADWSRDWCEVLDWYGDGICDDFCPNPDPDCEEPIDCTVSFVVPNCDPGFVLVDEFACAAAGDSCETDTTCGIDSHCLFVGEFCPQVVGEPAVCPADSFEVDECSSSDCVVARGTGDKCTDVALCETIDCTAALVAPHCEGNDMLVNDATCEAAGDRCTTDEVCGVTSNCLMIGDVCPQVVGTSPSCPADTTPVDECRDGQGCLIVNGTGDKCSEVAFCEPIQFNCFAPSCNDNDMIVNQATCDAAGDDCYTSECGNACLQVSDFCPQVVGTSPTCPADTTPVNECREGQGCLILNGSGDKCSETIFCEPFNF